VFTSIFIFSLGKVSQFSNRWTENEANNVNAINAGKSPPSRCFRLVFILIFFVIFVDQEGSREDDDDGDRHANVNTTTVTR